MVRLFTCYPRDAYAIKITNATVEDLTNRSDIKPGQWYRMESLPKILDEAVSFIVGWQQETP
ncbi:MAG: hypothetical protein H7296_05575 [Bacteroidia bacterium]|nr:hypothetical protein [Bacteroidia bacterium]